MDTPYRWMKARHGFAIINIIVTPSTNSQNEIIENYSGKGWTGQGNIDSIPQKGFDYWKIGAIKGLEYAFSLTNQKWKVEIFSIEGLIATDTNPTVVGYVCIRAFLEKVDFIPNDNLISSLEKFVLNSWIKPYEELIPDFFNLTFSKEPS